MTATINNQTFTVEVTGDKNFPYTLHGKRNAVYSLIRNVQGLLVPFSLTKKNLLGVYTDKNGFIEEVFA